MKKITSSLPFFKTVLLSISILAFSSVSSYAGQTNQPNPVKFQALHSDGVVTFVSNDGRISKPYPELSINMESGWVPRSWDAAQDGAFPWLDNAAALCPNGSCPVNVDGKDVPVSSLFGDGSADRLSAAGGGSSNRFEEVFGDEIARLDREICKAFGERCPAPPTLPSPPSHPVGPTIPCDMKCMIDKINQ